MKKIHALILAALMFVAGSAIAAGAAGDDGKLGPDPHSCAALVDLVLKQYDRAFVAEQGLYANPPRIVRAQLLLSRVNRTWPTFWVYAQDCSPNH